MTGNAHAKEALLHVAEIINEADHVLAMPHVSNLAAKMAITDIRCAANLAMAELVELLHEESQGQASSH